MKGFVTAEVLLNFLC